MIALIYSYNCMHRLGSNGTAGENHVMAERFDFMANQHIFPGKLTAWESVR